MGSASASGPQELPSPAHPQLSTTPALTCGSLQRGLRGAGAAVGAVLSIHEICAGHRWSSSAAGRAAPCSRLGVGRTPSDAQSSAARAGTGGLQSTALTPTLGRDAQRAGQRQRGDGVLVHKGRQAPCSRADQHSAPHGAPGIVGGGARSGARVASLPKYSSSLAPRRCTPLAEDSMRKCRTRSLLSSPLGGTEGLSAL